MKQVSEVNNSAPGPGSTDTESTVGASERTEANVSSGTDAAGSTSSVNDCVPEESQDKGEKSSSDAELTVPKANGHGPVSEMKCGQAVPEKGDVDTPKGEENSKFSPLIGKMDAVGESGGGRFQENPQRAVDAVSSSD